MGVRVQKLHLFFVPVFTGIFMVLKVRTRSFQCTVRNFDNVADKCYYLTCTDDIDVFNNEIMTNN